jgi:hypothetical protein
VEISLLSRAFCGSVMKLQFQDLQSGCADGEMKMRQDSSIIANLLSQIGQSSNA